MVDTPSMYAPALRERGFVPLYTIPLTEIFKMAGKKPPRLPLKPIYFWSKHGQPTTTIAVDELGYQWVLLGEHIDLSPLGFTDTGMLFPQLHLEHDNTIKN